MDQRDYELKISELLDKIKRRNINGGTPDFLCKCLRSYSSRIHIWNIYRDLELMRKCSPPPKKILDFGCGIGIQAYVLRYLGYEVTGLETVFDKSIKGFSKNKADAHIETRDDSMKLVWDIIEAEVSQIEFNLYDGENIPYLKDSFDNIFTYAVIEHIPKQDIPPIIEGIYRILRPGGLFYIFQLPQIYSYTEFLARALNIEAHEFLWTFEEISKILAKAGFRVILKERIDMFFNHPYWIINPLFSLIRPLNRLLLATPLAFFNHHLTIVAQKS